VFPALQKHENAFSTGAPSLISLESLQSPADGWIYGDRLASTEHGGIIGKGCKGGKMEERKGTERRKGKGGQKALPE